MAKGKSRTPYEFGAKVGIAMTLQHNLIVGARAFEGNPYDGHTLREQLEQAGILMQDTGMKPTTAYVDLGYRGVDADNPGIDIKHRGKAKSLTAQEWKLLKRRQAIEPIIGHLKGAPWASSSTATACQGMQNSVQCVYANYLRAGNSAYAGHTQLARVQQPAVGGDPNRSGARNASFQTLGTQDIAILAVPAVPELAQCFAGGPGTVHIYGLKSPYDFYA